jgi:hypothetical protein
VAPHIPKYLVCFHTNMHVINNVYFLIQLVVVLVLVLVVVDDVDDVDDLG